MRPDPELPVLFTREDARRRGLTDRQISYRLQTGVFVREGRGLLRRKGELTPAKAMALRSGRAWRTAGSDRTVISHTSAAAFWQLPSVLGPPPAPTLTAREGKGRRGPGVHLRVADLPPDHVDVTTGVAVSTPARTVLDCLRTLPPRDGLAIADAALHDRRTTAEELAGMADFQQGWPGIVAARELLDLADGRRESPLESWSAWAFEQAGLPRPSWQVQMFAPDGRLLGRVDALWDEGVVGEADGRAKYTMRAEADGRRVSTRRLQQVFDAEKRREAVLHDHGAEVVPWYSEDVLVDPRLTELVQRIRARIALSPRFRGTVVR